MTIKNRVKLAWAALRGRGPETLASSQTLGHPRDPALARYFAAPNVGGVRVDEHTAMQLTAVWCAIRVLSEGVAMLPLGVYRRLASGGRSEATDHPVHRLLAREPNPEMDTFAFRESRMAHLQTHGNAYAEIERGLAGRPLALWPLDPERVTPRRLPQAGLVYEVRNSSGVKRTLAASEVLHVAGLGYDGIIGYSPIRMCMRALGVNMATDVYGAAFFENGATPGGLLTHPGQLGEEAAKRLKADWHDEHGGPFKAHGLAVLEEGMRWEKVGIPPEEAQFLETRKFGITEIARIYRVPPHLLQDLERATFSNIEHLGLSFVTYTLGGWLTRWESALNRALFTRAEQQAGYYVKHNVNAFLRGDLKSRYDAYAIGRNWGWLSADDVLELEDKNPLPDGQGKTYFVPLNMTDAKQAGEPPPAATGSAPDEKAGDEEDEESPSLASRLQPVIADVLARMKTKEVNALKRLMGEPEKFLAAAQEFWARHEPQLAAALMPVAKSHVLLSRDRPLSPESLAAAWAGDAMQVSKAKLERAWSEATELLTAIEHYSNS